MKSIGLYKGLTYPEAQKLDLADLNVIDFVNGVDMKSITDEESKLCDDLVTAIENSYTQVTFNDNRYCLIATKLTRNVSADDANITYYIFTLQYIKAFYTSQNESVSSIIEFLTLFLEYSISSEPMSNDVLNTYKSKAKYVLDSDIENQLLLPLYVIESLREASTLEVNDVIVVDGANDIQEAPPVIVDVDAENGSVNVETPLEGDETVIEYRSTINTLNDLIQLGIDEESLNEYNATIDTLNQLIDMLSPKMKQGGKINVRKLAMKYASRNK